MTYEFRPYFDNYNDIQAKIVSKKKYLSRDFISLNILLAVYKRKGGGGGGGGGDALAVLWCTGTQGRAAINHRPSWKNLYHDSPGTKNTWRDTHWCWWLSDCDTGLALFPMIYSIMCNQTDQAFSSLSPPSLTMVIPLSLCWPVLPQPI